MKENQGNIKDYYKISSCIGRGKLVINIDIKWVSELVFLQIKSNSKLNRIS